MSSQIWYFKYAEFVNSWKKENVDGLNHTIAVKFELNQRREMAD